MKKSYLLCVVLVFVINITTPHTVLASPITITSNTVASDAKDNLISSDTFTGTDIPSSDNLSATIGNSSSITNINYTGDSGNVLISYDFTHAIDNTTGDTSNLDRARTYSQFLSFTATSNSTYSIDGFYDMLGPAGTMVYFDVVLYDDLANTQDVVLFRDVSASLNTENASFVLGNTSDGEIDYSSSNSGSNNGNLITGHDYKLFFTVFIQAGESTNPTIVSATANGEINLNISAVPIPPALWLFGSGLLGLVGIARRKKA